jgi:hypothetical protein
MILVLENKLSCTTPLTSPQSGALKSSGYRVRNERREPVLGNENLIKNTELRFSKDIQWYKVYDGTDGKAIQNIIKSLFKFHLKILLLSIKVINAIIIIVSLVSVSFS